MAEWCSVTMWVSVWCWWCLCLECLFCLCQASGGQQRLLRTKNGTSAASTSSTLVVHHNLTAIPVHGPNDVIFAKRGGEQQADRRLMHHDSGVVDGVVAVIGILMFGSLLFMMFFFWKRYKYITASLPTYRYSRLNQCDEEADGIREDELGMGLSLEPSSSEDELQPATLPAMTTQMNCTVRGSTYIPVHNHGTDYHNGVVTRVSASVLEDSDEELLQ